MVWVISLGSPVVRLEVNIPWYHIIHNYIHDIWSTTWPKIPSFESMLILNHNHTTIWVNSHQRNRWQVRHCNRHLDIKHVKIKDAETRNDFWREFQIQLSIFRSGGRCVCCRAWHIWQENMRRFCRTGPTGSGELLIPLGELAKKVKNPRGCLFHNKDTTWMSEFTFFWRQDLCQFWDNVGLYNHIFFGGHPSVLIMSS